MNIKDYISSGVVESYVLGLASSEERNEFEQYCRKFPELVDARNSFEIALERLFFTGAAAPVLGLREKIMDAIRQDASVHTSKIITMDNTSQARSYSSVRWVAAASVILLLVSAYFAFNFYTKNKDLQAELEQTKQQQAQLGKQLEAMEMVTDPNVAVVNLKGMEKTPKSSASVYWDSTSPSIYLVAKNMPKPASDKQYQLWSIINGKDGQLQPTSLGLFDVGDDGKIILRIDKAVRHADAFAITIEKKGNTGGPTLEDLQTMGKTGL